MHTPGAFEPRPRKRKVQVYQEHDAAFAALLQEAQERLARMHVALRDRSIRLCGANNSRKRRTEGTMDNKVLVGFPNIARNGSCGSRSARLRTLCRRKSGSGISKMYRMMSGTAQGPG